MRQFKHVKYKIVIQKPHFIHFELYRSLSRALTRRQKLAEKAAGGAKGFYILGLISEKRKKNKDALFYYRRAFKMDPSLWLAFERVCQLDMSSNLGLSDLFSTKSKRRSKDEVFLSKIASNMRKVGGLNTPKKMVIADVKVSKDRRSQDFLKRVKATYEGGKDNRKQIIEKFIWKSHDRSKMKKSTLGLEMRLRKGEDVFNIESMRNQFYKQNLTLLSKRTSPDISLSNSNAKEFRVFEKYAEKKRPPLPPSPAEISAENEKNTEILKRYLMKLGYAYRLMTLGKFNESVNMFNSLSKPLLTLHFVLINIAICYMHLVKYKSAEKLFNYAFEKEPYESYGLDYYSSCLWKLERAKTLYELASRFVHSKPFHENTWILMANCFSLNDDRQAALRFLHRAINLDPGHSSAHCLLGQEYFFMDELDKAAEFFKKASLLNSRQFFAWCGLGTVSLKCDKYKEALDFFVKAMCLNRKCPVVYSYIGICWANLNDPAKALNNFKKSEELDPKNTMNIYHKANSLYLLKEYNSALFELEKLKRENAHNESLVYLLYGKQQQHTEKR